jgi:ELWxxDGT repeat protein
MSAYSVFFANDGADGEQLWRTDGTAAGTVALTDFPSTNVAPSPITLIDGIAYFLEEDGNGPDGEQFQLWRTDGTAAGTYALGLSGEGFGSAPNIAQVGDVVYYIGSDDTHREALFASTDGQPGVFVANVETETNITTSVEFDGVAGNYLLFTAAMDQIWISDGTAAGTHPLSDGIANSPLEGGAALLTVNGETFFEANLGGNSLSQIWELSGDAAVAVTSPSIVGTGSEDLLGALNGELIFTVYNGSAPETLQAWNGVAASSTTLFSGASGIESPLIAGGDVYFTDVASGALYASNGTQPAFEVASGGFSAVVKLGDGYVLGNSSGVYIATASSTTPTLIVSGSTFTGDDSTFTQVGSKVYFIVNTSQLWVSDGTVAGTQMVVGGLLNPHDLVASGSELLFSAETSGTDFEPWVSNGTAAGTHVIAELHPSNPGALAIADETGLDGGLAFVGSTATTGQTLWVSNGTVAGTGALQNPYDVDIQPTFVSAGGNLYFLAGSENGPEVFVATSAEPGGALTQIPGGDGFYLAAAPTFLTAFDNQLFFYASSLLSQANLQPEGPALISSDGVDPATVVSDITVLAQPIVFGNELLFAGSNADGTGLFETDGTSAGTVFIAAIPTAVTPASFTVSGSQVFFVAGSATSGPELWITDGTAVGTHLVDALPTNATSGAGPAQFTAFDGGVVFTTNDQVWFSSGTAAGTFQLPINQTTSPATLQISSGASVNGETYFVANDGLHGDQLWETNGTAAGTAEVTELSSTATTLSASSVIALNGKLFFVDNGQAWVSDGTAAGTAPLPVGSGFTGVLPGTPTLVDGEVVFQEIASSGPDGLFVTNGTATGTQNLGSLNAFGQNVGFEAAGDLVIFGASTGLVSYNAATQAETPLPISGNNDGIAIDVGGQITIGTSASALNNGLWVTDGTVAGTVNVVPNNESYYTDYTSAGGELYFLSVGINPALWVTNGTVAGTYEVLENTVIQEDTLTAIGSNLFYLANNASGETVAWIYNTSSQTAAEISAPAVASVPIDVTPVGTGAFFVANDATTQNELWHVTSTGQVVELTSAKDGEVAGASDFPPPLIASGSSLFFSGDDSVHGEGLFVSNGSSVTFLAAVDDPTDFSVIGGLLYFQGTDATNGAQLWVSNGTAAGTTRLTSVRTPGSTNGSDFTVVGSQMFYTANDGVHGQQLWVFDGQAGGASMVTDLNPSAGGANPTDLTAFDGALYFVASNGVGAPELWTSNGASAGTSAVTTAANGASPQDLTVDGSDLFFFGADSTHGSGLFVDNGAGVSFVAAFSAASDFTVQGGELYFLGVTSAGSELWTSDGTPGGTVKLTTTGVDPGSDPANITAVGQSQPFAAHNDFNGDGKSDFLIENTSGAVVVGEAVNGQAAFTVVADLGPEWSFHGAADFLGDGNTDFLIQNSAGSVDVGEVAGGQTTYTQVASLGSEWSFVGTGDFLGDGKSDFLIENTSGDVFIGEVMSGEAAYTGVVALGSEWSFVGTGDFLGEGHDQFMIENTSGDVFIGDYANGQIAFTGVTGLGSEWKFVGIGDYLGEGHDQFLIENSAGAIVVGDWSGGAVNFTQIASLGPEWTFVGSGDYLGEGHDEFLVENASGAVDIGDWTGGAIHYTQVTGLGSEWAFH